MRPGNFFETCRRCNVFSKSCDASCVDPPSKEQQLYDKKVKERQREAEEVDMTSN